MLNISLLDIDGKLANIALMKIAQYHKNDNIDWFSPSISKPDILYCAKLFDFTPDYSYYPSCKIIKGGTGFDVYSKLPDEIEKLHPDYNIYPGCDYSQQFFSRGCIRKCPFCIVNKKEGNILSVDPMNLNPNGKYIKVLDNNFFANPEWKQAIKYLQGKKQPIDLNGVDARIITDEQCHALNTLKHCKQVHMAWDNPNDDLTEKFKMITKIIKPYKIMVYVLIGYWSTPEQDLYRVEKLRELKIDPFVMPFNKSDTYQKKFARWCNHKAIFKTVKWEDYNV